MFSSLDSLASLVNPYPAQTQHCRQHLSSNEAQHTQHSELHHTLQISNSPLQSPSLARWARSSMCHSRACQPGPATAAAIQPTDCAAIRHCILHKLWFIVPHAYSTAHRTPIAAHLAPMPPPFTASFRTCQPPSHRSKALYTTALYKLPQHQVPTPSAHTCP